MSFTRYQTSKPVFARKLHYEPRVIYSRYTLGVEGRRAIRDIGGTSVSGAVGEACVTRVVGRGRPV